MHTKNHENSRSHKQGPSIVANDELTQLLELSGRHFKAASAPKIIINILRTNFTAESVSKETRYKEEPMDILNLKIK